MPQNPEKITEAFEQITKARSDGDKKRINDAKFFDAATENMTGINPETVLTQGATIKYEIIDDMRSAIATLRKKNQISEEHFNNATNALNFYDKNTNVHIYVDNDLCYYNRFGI